MNARIARLALVLPLSLSAYPTHAQETMTTGSDAVGVTADTVADHIAITEDPSSPY